MSLSLCVRLVSSQGLDQVSGPWRIGWSEAQVSVPRLLCSVKAPASCHLACLDLKVPLSLPVKVVLSVVMMTVSQILALC